ncbi:MAG TPA: HAMP domain-containing sensor histidine kinase, partial [Cytophagaceae bacterium]
EVAPVIEMINTSISKFKTTIRDLTEITKLQKEKEDDIGFVDIPEILEEVKLSIKLVIINSKTTIDTDFNVKQIRFSVKHLRSIIYNLISNAIKYSHPNRTPHIRISTYVSGDFTVLSVEDNGLGMENENKTKIFSMFKRLHDHVEGSGVGLYIVKKIIDNAGGHIEVDSKVGEGSTFRVYFKNS